jgi:SagB-type dehydrogenase family enzyme
MISMYKLISLLIVIPFSFLLFKTQTFSQGIKDIELPMASKSGGKPLMDALNARSSAREFSSKELPLQELSDLLWAADGINRPELNKRTAPTAMNWQDTDIFIILRSGIYLYLPIEHKLKLRKAGNYMKFAGKQDFVENAALNLVFVSDFSKMKSSSDEDKILFAGIHTGCISQNVYLFCASAGLNTVTRRLIDIEKLSSIMELSSTEKIILSQSVGYKP